MTPTNTPAPASEAADVEPVASWSYSINYGPDGEENWANLTTPEGDHVANIRTHHAVRIVAALAYPSTEVERLTRERDAARQALEHDRALVITACNAFNDAFLRRQWLLDSRGPYEWDDDRYRDEFKGAYDELNAAVEPLIKVGKDWSNCPVDHDEIMRSRQDWQSRATTAESTIHSLKKKLAEVERQRDEAASLLEPFANEADQWEGYDDGECLVEGWENGPSSSITVGDLRHARALLSKLKEGRP